MELCKICSQPASGHHFGVLTCRACAAFFRRGAKNLYKYRCSGGFGNCEIFKNERYNCKKCRLKKCIAEGMDETKFQHNRDLIQSSPLVRMKRKLPFTSDSSPTWLYLNELGPGKTFVDLKYLLNQADGILKKNPKKTYSTSSSLHKISKAIDFYRQLPTCSNLQMINKFGKHQKLQEWENSFLLVAQWLTHFDAFQQLEAPLKMEILKTIWHIWVQMDRLAMNAIGRKRGLCSERLMIVGRRCLVDLEDLALDVHWFSNYPKEEMNFFLEQIDWNLFNLITPMISLSPTDIELTYMTLQLCFNYAGKRLQNEALTVCDQFLEELSNDLHRYYVEDLKMERYSVRLAQLMKMNQMIEKDIVDKRWKYEVGRVFNVWKLEFSHPEVFQDNSC